MPRPVRPRALHRRRRRAFAASAAADTVTVITSFPKELTTAYKKAFEAKYPNDKVEILNKNTAAGIAYVREQPAGSRPEIFWASAPDAFEVLSSSKLLQKIDAPNPAIPAKVGNYPVNDPEGFYLGQALAGYGIMWNTRYLEANKLPEPKEWADLVEARSTSATSRSRARRARARRTSPSRRSCRAKAGTRAGSSSSRSPATAPRSPSAASACPTAWPTASSASASSSTSSASPRRTPACRSSSSTRRSRRSCRPTSRSSTARRRPRPASASSSSRSPTKARQLLLDKQISRLPVLPATYAKAPAGYPNPFAGKIQAKVNFDSNLSESRYYVVVSLFDQLITFRHKELAAATKAIHDAQKRLGTRVEPRSSTRRGGSCSRRRSTRSRPPTRRSSPSSRPTRRTPTPPSAGADRGGVGGEGEGQLREGGRAGQRAVK